MKKWILAVTAAAVLLTTSVSAAPLMGGWEATEDAAVTDEARGVFERALEGLTGAEYEPVGLLATQVVSGTNYCFLCRSRVVVPDAEPGYCLVYIYEDLEGNAEILGFRDIEFGEGILEEEPADDSEDASGDIGSGEYAAGETSTAAGGN